MASIIESALRPELVKLHLENTEKKAIIRELVQILADAKVIGDQAAVEKALLERERQLSTGLHDGIAIPHGKTDAVDKLHVAIGLKPEGVDFDCVDGQPARIFIITVSPASQTGPHIRFMADISRLLRQADVRSRLLSAQTQEEVVALLITEAS